MGDRYRYNARPRSPVYNPARASLPITLPGFTHPTDFVHPASHEHHMHVVPTRRELIPAHSRSGSTVSNAGTVTTTYKIKADPPSRSSSHRDGSRNRSSTLDSHSRPAVVTTVQTRHKPVVHSGRPASPTKNPYRSSDEEYFAVPASSNKHGHGHRKRYSMTMDNADMNRLARDRDGSRLRTGSGREAAPYSARPRPMYTSSAVRHADTVADDYGDDGYGYTNPRDLVQYDLNNNSSSKHRSRRDSFDSGGGRTSRPSSIGSYGDIIPRTYDPRERGPPPSTRGFDKIPRGATWDQPMVRMPVAPPPPMEPISRPARMDHSFEEQPARRNSSRRPVSTYHDQRERKGSHDDYFEVRDDDRRERSHRTELPRDEPPRFENPVEQRGFGIRAEMPSTRSDIPPPRPERPERADRPERSDRLERSDRPKQPDRPERSDRLEISERKERTDRSDRSDDDRGEHKSSRDAIAASISLAGAALGLKAAKKSRDDREEREEKEERRHRDYEDEPRRHRESRDEREPVDLGGRDKERRHRDDDRDRDVPAPRDANPRDIPPPPRDKAPSPKNIPPPPRDVPPTKDKDLRDRPAPEPPVLNLGARSSKDREASRSEGPSSRNERESDSDRRERHKHRDEAMAIAIDSRSDDSSPEPATSRPRGSRSSKEPGAPAPFNPKDTMDLKALKEALNSKENDPPKDPDTPKEPAVSRTPRASTTKDVAEVAQIRSDLKDERKSRDTLALVEKQQPRVVSPPRAKPEEKPVKGILRAPREKFPEDPSPIREGVAPLKDAKKDGVPPDARWTKISRKLVNPEALKLGKERYEARDDFVIVLRVLSRDEVQGYAEVTQKIRAAREQAEGDEAREQRRRARRDRHERHKRERSRGERTERSERRRRRERDSESDTTEDEDREVERDVPKLLEPAPPRRRAASNNFEDVMVSGGLGSSNLREDPNSPGQYLGYTRNPPPPSSLVTQSSGSSGRRDK